MRREEVVPVLTNVGQLKYILTYISSHVIELSLFGKSKGIINWG